MLGGFIVYVYSQPNKCEGGEGGLDGRAGGVERGVNNFGDAIFC